MKSENKESLSDADEIISLRKCKRKIIYTSSEEDNFSCDTSNEIHQIPIKRLRILSTSESENDGDNDKNFKNTCDEEWLDPVGNQPRLVPFKGKSGFKLEGNYNKIEHFYSLLVTDEIIETIVKQTNIYAAQVLNQKQSTRLNDWIPTSRNEVKRFFGLIIWMGLVRLPEIHLYWSKDPAFAQDLPCSVMSRNRFELMLRMLHFMNNEETDTTDRLYKVRVIIEKLNENFQKCYDPPEIVYVNESVIPFHGHLIFHYIKQKRHKYGIKIFKLCFSPGYTYQFDIYCGKKLNAKKTIPSNIIMSLCKKIFGKGHTVCADNSSIDLAEKLIAKKTHFIGTIRANRRGLSKEVVSKKLKRGELLAKENKKGITLLKWKDKRDVLIISTKHSTAIVNIRKKGHNVNKPKAIFDYNESKFSVDMSNQMVSYANPLRKGVKWYKKLVFDLLLNTAVVNSWVMHNSVINNCMNIIEFRKQLALYLIHCQDEKPECHNLGSMVNQKKRHELEKKDGKVRTTRRRCVLCYKKNVKKLGATAARNSTIRVATFCSGCPNEPHLCLSCFNTKHRNMSL